MKIYKKTTKTRLGVRKKVFVRKETYFIPKQNESQMIPMPKIDLSIPKKNYYQAGMQ